MPRTLFIDADACPVTRESIDCARRAGVAVVTPATARKTWNGTFAATTRAMPSTRDAAFWVTTLDVSVGADSADFAIVERLQAGDVVVTQDIGLASMVLGRDAAAIGVRGRVYDKANHRHAAVYSPRGKEGTPRRRTHSRSGSIYQRRPRPL